MDVVCLFFNDYSTEERRLNWISVGGKQNTFGNTNTDLKILTLKMLRKSKRTQTHTVTYPVKKKLNWINKSTPLIWFFFTWLRSGFNFNNLITLTGQLFEYTEPNCKGISEHDAKSIFKNEWFWKENV